MKTERNNRQYFFSKYLLYTSVAHSLWRCYECERFSKEILIPPILDLGCGDGFFAQTVFGHLQAGIDMDPGEVKRAQERGTYDHAIVASATKMPFKNGSFNTVISNCVIEHIPEVEKVLSEVNRVLKPGGRFLISVPSEYWNADSFYQKVFNSIGFDRMSQWYNRTLNFVSKHHHVNNLSTWKTRFKKAGLNFEYSEYLIPIPVFHAFERWFLPAIPSKIWKALFKRWVLLPRFWAPPFFNWWFKNLLKLESKTGACYFLIARKAKGKYSR